MQRRSESDFTAQVQSDCAGVSLDTNEVNIWVTTPSLQLGLTFALEAFVSKASFRACR